MTRLALVFAIAGFGCAHDPGARAPEALTQIQWSGPPPHVGLQLAGAGASSELQAQCEAAATHSGVVVDGNAALQAIVTLDAGGDRLDLLSQKRGVVRSEKRAPLPVERLCAQAAVAAATALREELAGSPMDSRTNSYAIVPVRMQDLHSPTSHVTGPDTDLRQNVGAGASSHGPID